MTIKEINGKQYNVEGEIALWLRWLAIGESSGESRLKELELKWQANEEILAEAQNCYVSQDEAQGRVLAEKLFTLYGSRYNRFVS